MSCEDLVNLILEKLRTGRVRFVRFNIDEQRVRFLYGCVEYVAGFSTALSQVLVLVDGITEDNYSKWMEGVLNGKTRDDQGVLS